MRYRTYDYRHGEIILNANHRLKKEIERVLTQMELTVPRNNGLPPDSHNPHRQIQRAFRRHGWQAEALVTGRTAKRHYFDLYKDRVAIEIELSNRELLYRDYYRFQMAARDDRLDVGVILLLDEEARFSHPLGGRNGAPRIEDVADDLTSLRGEVDVPLWVVSLY